MYWKPPRLNGIGHGVWLSLVTRLAGLCYVTVLATAFIRAEPSWAQERPSADSTAATTLISDRLSVADSAEPLPEATGDFACSATPPRLWIRGECLLWWTEGNRLPPLLTSSPDGTERGSAGFLGPTSTRILFGDERIDQDVRPGVRIRAGYWLDTADEWGLEADLVGLGTGTATGFETPLSNGTPILARPIFNMATGLEDAQLVAFPALVDGNLSVHTCSDLYSAAALLRKNWRADGHVRWDLVGGYRFLQLREQLRIGEHLISRADSPVILPGTLVDVTDEFRTDNTFHGGEVGLDLRLARGPLTLGLLAKMALGNMHEAVLVQGSTQVTKPGESPFDRAGGLLALPSNSGLRTRNELAVLPEVDANLEYRLTPRLSLTCGFTWLLLNRVLQTGDQIDRRIDPSQLSPLISGPTAPNLAAVYPAMPFAASTFWACGANVGLQLNY